MSTTTQIPKSKVKNETELNRDLRKPKVAAVNKQLSELKAICAIDEGAGECK